MESYLLTLPAIRQRSFNLFEQAQKGHLQYFDYNQQNELLVANYCVDLITHDYGSNYSSIPPHGRWRHLHTATPLINSWSNLHIIEKSKRLIDLFFISVLLDAGAGNAWQYRDSEFTFTRSEGLAVATFNMFKLGLFSSHPDQPFRVDANGLSSITLQKMAEAFQVTDSNPIVGLQGRTTLLSNLASALNNNPTFFGQDARPGNIIDHLQHHLLITHNNPPQLPLTALWHVLIHGLSSIWPSSTTSLNGIPLGDVWTCPALTPLSQSPGDDLIPFHKLTSWLTYSIIEPIEQILGWLITEKDLLTGLPEYRNGGLLIDLGVLSLKPGSIPLHPDTLIPRLPPSHPAIVEWRAMTIIELDRIADLIRDILGLSPQQLSLPQILESATWKAGRIIANQIRPLTGGPPIDIESDGTVF